MEVERTPLPGVLRLKPRVFRDERGRFLETWRRERYVEAGLPADFVQDNAAISGRGVLRGLHFQYPEPQGKLILVLEGEVFDAAVDVRRGSPHFGQWTGAVLSAENGHQLWIPEGFAHGYLTVSETAVVAYKCTRRYNPEGDAAIRYDDPEIGIEWPLSEAPALSGKDASAPRLGDLDPGRLPPFTGSVPSGR